MSETNGQFKDRVCGLVAQIPKGRVMTYGQIAAMCGNAAAARIVGGIAHYGDPDMPWQRVVNKNGGLASGYPGGREAHAEALKAEGIEVRDGYYINIDELLWHPGSTEEYIPTKRLQTPSYKLQTSPAPLVSVVGATASGKTNLAIELAEKFNGEIIAADSRTVYKEMDIGTAKPTIEEMNRVPHHLIDVVYPNEQFSAAQFKELAVAAIANIHKRDKIPIVAGGSGLYIDSLLYDFEFVSPPDVALRESISAMSVEEMQNEIRSKGLKLPTNYKNPRHLARILETGGISTQKKPPRANTLIIGLSIDREALVRNVTDRVEAMVNSGLVEEVKNLILKYGKDTEALRAPGYKAFISYIDGDISLAEAKKMFIKNDLQLAKRQRTWFKRNKSIRWCSDPSKAVELATTFLNKIK